MTINFSTLTMLICLACTLVTLQAAPAPALSQIVSHPKRTPQGVHLPIKRQSRSTGLSRRGDVRTSAGVGDDQDISYIVQMQIGNSVVPLVLDTGSSDIWVASTDCQENICLNSGTTLYSPDTFQSSNLTVRFNFGDSVTGTHAAGEIGTDTITLAGMEIEGQIFASINDTTDSALQLGASGLFGLGFPGESPILVKLFKNQFPEDTSLPSTFLSKKRSLLEDSDPDSRKNIKRSLSHKRDSLVMPESLDDLLASFATEGPLMARLSQNELAFRGFTMSLQRETFEIGGNQGLFSIGELPPGVSNESFTWVPVTRYTAAEGGIVSDTEVYPMSWEIPLDNVFIDGQLLPLSTISPNTPLSALIDTGNSLIRGPKDVVAALNIMLAGSPVSNIIDCKTPHTLAFQIGGKMFPVDPRDFATPAEPGNLDSCKTSVVSTDPPSFGFKHAWSFGDQLFKSAIVSFYFGNLTHPSVDPPRIGFLSTVPPDANDRYLEDLVVGKENGGNLPTSFVPAPAPTIPVFTTIVAPSKTTNSMTAATSAFSSKPTSNADLADAATRSSTSTPSSSSPHSSLFSKEKESLIFSAELSKLVDRFRLLFNHS